METLAFLYLTVAYEDSAPDPELRTFDDFNLKASQSTAISLITACFVAGATIQTDSVQSSLYNAGENHNVVKLQSTSSNIDEHVLVNSRALSQSTSCRLEHRDLEINSAAQLAALSNLESSVLDSRLPNLQQNLVAQSNQTRETKEELERFGQLVLVNDTPYDAVVLLYQPKQEQPYRYAYMPSNSRRPLLDTYSNLWQVSLDGKERFTISGKATKRKNSFELNLSKLDKNNSSISFYEGSYQSELVLGKDSFLEAAFKTIQKLSKQADELRDFRGTEMVFGQSTAQALDNIKELKTTFTKQLAQVFNLPEKDARLLADEFLEGDPQKIDSLRQRLKSACGSISKGVSEFIDQLPQAAQTVKVVKSLIKFDKGTSSTVELFSPMLSADSTDLLKKIDCGKLAFSSPSSHLSRL
jgi:hypothetical protein